MRLAAGGWTVVALLLLPWAAHAQPSTRTLAAEELFTQGRALITQHHYKEACEKLDASQKLEPAVGTLVSLGECYAGLGRAASSWLAYRSAMALATERSDPRRAAAEERAAAMEPQISDLEVHPGSATPGAQITIDGEAFTASALGAPVPIDPGAHEVVASAPGYKTWSTKVDVAPLGGHAVVEVPPLEPLPDPHVVEAEHRAAATRRTVGLALGGAGVVGLGVGAVLGLHAIAKIHDANDVCPSGPTCGSASAVGDNQTGKTFGIASTIVLPVSAALVGAGAYLYLTARAPHGAEIGAEAAPGGARVRVAWAW